MGLDTSMGLLEPGRRIPAKLPSALYRATVWKSRAMMETPRGCCTLGLTLTGSAGIKVAHSFPFTPVNAHAPSASDGQLWIPQMPTSMSLGSTAFCA